jgi:hypothetical protein
MTEITEPMTAAIAGRYLAVASGRYVVTAAGDVARHDDIVTFTIQLTAPDGEVAWAACVFLLLGEDGFIRQDYHLTVKPLANTDPEAQKALLDRVRAGYGQWVAENACPSPHPLAAKPASRWTPAPLGAKIREQVSVSR